MPPEVLEEVAFEVRWQNPNGCCGKLSESFSLEDAAAMAENLRGMFPHIRYQVKKVFSGSVVLLGEGDLQSHFWPRKA